VKRSFGLGLLLVALLVCGAGIVVNRKKVRRLMRRHGMAGRHRRRRCRTTFPGPDGSQIGDLIGRRFEPGAPDVAWVQDITYVPTSEGWLYVASVLDLGSRRLIGYSMADHMRSELVLDALTMAVTARGGDHAVAGVITHADRGSQYTSNDYLDYCHARQLRPSVGRTGVLGQRRRRVVLGITQTRMRARQNLRDPRRSTPRDLQMDQLVQHLWYNTSRLHSSLDHIPPLQWEQRYRQAS
jgi:transposase InsO family protein